MHPKAFISYSWTSPAHQEWVLKLATDLRESGVDVTLDIWDLKEGHDATAFMERMVSDIDIKKVIIVCDRAYMDKANGRSGGVGAETQIITPELYGKQEQDKFVAVLPERDEAGNAFLPIYFKPRIYIDLSESSSYAENFDRLLRWIFDKPLHIKPPVGKAPNFLNEIAQPNLLTSAKFRRAMEALRSGLRHGPATAREYFDDLARDMEKFRLRGEDYTEETYDDAVIQSIENFVAYRNEAISILEALARFADTGEAEQIAHAFLEKLLRLTYRPEGITQWQTWNFDNYRFIAHEMLLYTVAIFIKSERFGAAAHIIETEYFVANDDTSRRSMRSCGVFVNELRSFDKRNKRLNLRRTSLQADFIKDRCKGVSVEFRDLMQADFILFLHARLTEKWWFPVTLVYVDHIGSSAFELFARAKSKRYFARIAPMLGLSNIEEFRQAVKKLSASSDTLPRWNYHRLAVWEAAGVEDIGTSA